jgi:NADPH2 dehydrogenase
MSNQTFLHLGSLHAIEDLQSYLAENRIEIPIDKEIDAPGKSPLNESYSLPGLTIGNRFTVHPMEGWDGTLDGRPSELTFRRWRNFGRSGAKLIWGGEAVAVLHEGRANPNQLQINDKTRDDLARLRDALVATHVETFGSSNGLVVGLQLTHSGRYSRPNPGFSGEPRILHRHPILDRRLGLPDDYPLLNDGEIRSIIEAFHHAARKAQEIGFDFIDVKHCHGYLGHEFLSSRTRDGDYGGCFENRTRFLREVVEGVRASAPALEIGVRLSAFDLIPFRPDPARSHPGKPGPGIPEEFASLLPYEWGFGVNRRDPLEYDLEEPIKFLGLLEDLGIKLVNISGGSPYYNPHVQRPAMFPPSDGYQPPEDPLLGVARHLSVARYLKQRFPGLFIVGTGFTYLQEFLPHVAQPAVRNGWVDSVGLGRMVLSYPELPSDILEGRAMQRKRICRTFSDCTTAPRNGLPSGCYPLDANYKQTAGAERLRELKHRARSQAAEDER